MADVVSLTPVESTFLAGIGYDADARTLHVAYTKNGHIWRYDDVPPAVAEGLLAAESKGRYFGAHVRGQFPATKITDTCPSCGDIGLAGQSCADCGTANYGDRPAQKEA